MTIVVTDNCRLCRFTECVAVLSGGVLPRRRRDGLYRQQSLHRLPRLHPGSPGQGDLLGRRSCRRSEALDRMINADKSSSLPVIDEKQAPCRRPRHVAPSSVIEPGLGGKARDELGLRDNSDPYRHRGQRAAAASMPPKRLLKARPDIQGRHVRQAADAVRACARRRCARPSEDQDGLRSSTTRSRAITRFSFLGNVEIGSLCRVEQLREAYHAVILACGASADRRLGIPAKIFPAATPRPSSSAGTTGIRIFAVCTFDLSCDTAIVIGHGNVAADVARILATPVDILAKTDIAEHALDELSRSRVRDIYVIGRRGPAQAKFTAVELKELGAISGCAAMVDAAELGTQSGE